jgi:hypothetical protein
MPEQNQQPIEPNNQISQVAPTVASVPPPAAPTPQNHSSAAKKVFKIIGIVFGVLIILFILFLSWGFYLLKHDKTANQQPASTLSSNQTNINQPNQTDSYTENQLEKMLLPKGSSEQELADQETAIQYIFKHPEVVNPFLYASLSAALIKQGNIEQAAFWFYIFQSRTGAWVANDPDQSASPALKASFNEVLGGPINQWLGSDVNAWHDLAARAISYEKKFPFYKGKIDSVPDQQWQQALLDGRQKYESGFNSAFAQILTDGGKSSYDQRKANGLYVGPWQNPGKPLLDEWK